MPPVKNPCVMTSYGGIIRIRLKGRSSVTSSQPASQAPLYLFYLLVYTLFYKKQVPIKKLPLSEGSTVNESNSYLFVQSYKNEERTSLPTENGTRINFRLDTLARKKYTYTICIRK